MLTKNIALLLIIFSVLLTSCGFHLQGERELIQPLKRVFLVTNDPYGQLARNLKAYLKLSHVTLVNSSKDASTILRILSDETSQDLLSVSGSQQTRQYNLRATVVFDIAEPTGRALITPQTLSEIRTITIQSNQILGSSNEASLFYQQMKRTIAYDILNRISSNEIATHIQQSLITARASEKK